MRVFGTEATFVNGAEHGTLLTRETSQTIDAAYPGVEKGALLPGFIDEVLGLGKAAVSQEEVFAALDVCFAIDEAAATGTSVTLAS